MTKEITLSTGRKLTIKPMGFYERHVVTGAVPDLIAARHKGEAEIMKRIEDDPAFISNVQRGRLRLLMLCIESPRYWADLRPLEEQDKEPRDCPKGREPFDLSEVEFEEAYEQVMAITPDVGDRVSPLSQTAAPSS